MAAKPTYLAPNPASTLHHNMSITGNPTRSQPPVGNTNARADIVVIAGSCTGLRRLLVIFLWSVLSLFCLEAAGGLLSSFSTAFLPAIFRIALRLFPIARARADKRGRCQWPLSNSYAQLSSFGGQSRPTFRIPPSSASQNFVKDFQFGCVQFSNSLGGSESLVDLAVAPAGESDSLFRDLQKRWTAPLRRLGRIFENKYRIIVVIFERR